MLDENQQIRLKSIHSGPKTEIFDVAHCPPLMAHCPPLAEKQLFAIWSEYVRTQEKLRRGFSTTLGGAYTATAKSDRHPLCIEKIACKVGIWSQNRSNALISHFDQNLFCVW